MAEFEMSEKGRDLMIGLLPELKKLIMVEAEKLTDPEEKFNFVLMSAMNLLGNLTLHGSRTSQDFVRMSHITLTNLSEWFEKTIAMETRREEGTH